MNQYNLAVKNRKTGLFEIVEEGNANSRCHFLKLHDEKVKQLRNEKVQWKCQPT